MLRAAAATQETGVQALASKFGIKDHVEVLPGKGGLPKVVLKHSSGTKAEVRFACTEAAWLAARENTAC